MERSHQLVSHLLEEGPFGVLWAEARLPSVAQTRGVRLGPE